jgi:hypothetical protein
VHGGDPADRGAQEKTRIFSMMELGPRFALSGENPGAHMANAARQLLDLQPEHGSTCRHPRVLAGNRRGNLATIRCRDCAHDWTEVQPVTPEVRFGAPWPALHSIPRLR